MRSGVTVIGVDDGPFERGRKKDVLVVGAVFQGKDRFCGVLSTRVRQDGRNATDRLIAMIGDSPFHSHMHYLMLDGIALGGFNVVDVPRLHRALERPVVVLSRNQPNPEAMRAALLNRIPGGEGRWKLVQAAGPIHPIEGVHCQLVGITPREAASLIRLTRLHGKIPEPLRAAHLIAGGVVRGWSRGRA